MITYSRKIKQRSRPSSEGLCASSNWMAATALGNFIWIFSSPWQTFGLCANYWLPKFHLRFKTAHKARSVPKPLSTRIYWDVYLTLSNNLKLQAPEMSKWAQFLFNRFISSCLSKHNKPEKCLSETWDRLRHVCNVTEKWSLPFEEGNNQNKQQLRTRRFWEALAHENELPAGSCSKTPPEVWAVSPLP